MGQPDNRLTNAIATTIGEFAKEAAQHAAFLEIAADVSRRIPDATPDELRALREFIVNDSVRIERLRKTAEARIAWQEQALVTIDGRLKQLEA